MITKEQIIEILCNLGGYIDRSRTDQGVHEDNFADVADEILSKLSQHDVMRSAFKEAYDKWHDTEDGELGNWLFAKSKGITT